MVVYVEYVIIDNMAIDYLLISLARKTLKLKPNFLLALISAVVGTVAAFLIPTLSINKGALFSAKVVVGMVISAIAASSGISGSTYFVIVYLFYIPFYSAERSSLFLFCWGRNTTSLPDSATANFPLGSAYSAVSLCITR